MAAKIKKFHDDIAKIKKTISQIIKYVDSMQ